MHFTQLPDPPKTIQSTLILKRLVDGLGFRYQVATDGISEEEGQFRPIESSMSISEVNVHIFHLVRLTLKSLKIQGVSNADLSSFETTRQASLEQIHSLSTGLEIMTNQDLSECQVYMKRLDTTFSFWYLINGFLADALTHVGQINSWRRMAGNPVAKISPFNGQPF